jgi:phospholipid/cholesterol/gamma-HCH transport system substrate-binding protein
MKIRFSRFEKIAGLFVGLAFLSCVAGMAAIAIKNGWLSMKVTYQAEIESADGVHAGTVVQIAGLRVGSVTAVELESNDRVRVKFEILERFSYKVRRDSVVQMFRPFILSEKVLEITAGRDDQPELPAGSLIPVAAAYDIMDFLSGKKMAAVLTSFDNLADSLRVVGQAFADKKRTQSLIQIFDRLNPLVQNLNTMSVEVVKLTSVANKQQRAELIVGNLAKISSELEQMLPAFNREVPDVGVQLGQIVKNLNVLTTEFQKLTPALNAIAPELPRTSRRAVEALDETVVLLKAMQRSFLFRGKVEDVREEEKARLPANTSEP